MAVTNVAELNELVARVKKPSANMPTSLKSKWIESSALPPSPLLMPVSRWPKWPWKNPEWVSSKTK